MKRGNLFIKIFLVFTLIVSIIFLEFVSSQTKDKKLTSTQISSKKNIPSEKKMDLTPQVEINITTPTAEKKGEVEMYEYKEPEPPPTSSIILSLAKAVIYLAVIIFLICITILLLKIGMSKKSPLVSGSISILESFYFAPNKSIQIIDIAGTIYIIGVSEKGMDLIKEIKEKEEIDKIKSKILSSSQIPFKNYLSSFTKVFSGQKDQATPKENDALSSNIDFKNISSLKENINKLKTDK